MVCFSRAVVPHAIMKKSVWFIFHVLCAVVARVWVDHSPLDDGARNPLPVHSQQGGKAPEP